MTKSYYHRNIDNELIAWSKENDRKILLLRGARQVGKTSAVRHFGASFKYYVEVNFDEQEELHTLFDGKQNVDATLKNAQAKWVQIYAEN